MVTAEVTVLNKTGLHARPATTFAAAAAKFQSAVKVRNMTKNGKLVNAKSTVRILSLAASQGTQIEISAEGEDETIAVESLVKMIEDGFGEL